MSKPIKGVIPAKASSTQSSDKASVSTELDKNSDSGTLKPISKKERNDSKRSATSTVNIHQSPEAKMIRTPTTEEMEFIVEAITDKLMKVFVTRDEVKGLVGNILQEMVVSESKVSKK